MVDIRGLYWAAGFLEGEGSFMDSRSKNHKTGKKYANHIVICSQIQKEPLERLNTLFGGNIALFKFGPTSFGRGGNIWRWQTSGRRARGIMMTLFSSMSPRRKEQIKKALSGPWGLRHKTCRHGINGKWKNCKICIHEYNVLAYKRRKVNV